jgi:hypothetical protein
VRVAVSTVAGIEDIMLGPCLDLTHPQALRVAEILGRPFEFIELAVNALGIRAQFSSPVCRAPGQMPRDSVPKHKQKKTHREL